MWEQEINPQGIEEAEIVVGIPSYNEADCIGFPTIQANTGLEEFFADKSKVIINCDNASDDGTREVFLNTSTSVPKIYLSTPPDIRGKGHNIRNLFRKAIDLNAKAILILDADLKSITPTWIKHLLSPIFQDFGFVAPLYVRHKYDSLITNAIAYPMIRSLFGRRIRQPLGGEFAFSGELAKIFFESPFWNDDIAQFGIDIWMTIVAIAKNIPCCQSFVGRPKIHRIKEVSERDQVFEQVVATIFYLMEEFETSWIEVKWSKPTAIYGFGLGEIEMPPKIEVDYVKMFERFNKGVLDFQDTYKEVLDPVTMNKLLEITELSEIHFDFPTELWARILFDYSLAFRLNILGKDQILSSLLPLYIGKCASFVKKTRRLSIQQAEETIENNCMVFENTKSYLIKKWEATVYE